MNGPGSRFLGIDFGWEGKPTGVAALEWTGNSLHSLSLDTRAGDDAVLAWIDEFARGNTVAGVDAPLVIPNASGMRDADKLAHAGYGRYHAGCYPASRERRYWQRTTGLCRALEERGFRHGDRMPVQAGGRWQIEVHPHAASVQLFRLDRILKYKRGAVPDRRAELERYRALLLEHARRWTPRLALLSLPSIPAGGAALKAVEDQLDALLCAYIAAHWWFWGRSRNDVLGDAARGYIVVPQRGAAGLPLAGLRETYALAGLDEADMDPDPLAQFQKWFAEARAAGLREPNAMTLATADASGAPDARIVLLKGANESGFVFFTNYGSAKGIQLAANPSAALVFYWGELERQVRVRGRVRKLSRADSAAYFETRPRGSRLGAWVSRQSHPVSSRAELEQALAGLEARFPDEVPLPPFWGGYRLIPHEIEFWQGRPNRLHDRFLYRKHRRGWSLARLSP